MNLNIKLSFEQRARAPLVEEEMMNEPEAVAFELIALRDAIQEIISELPSSAKLPLTHRIAELVEPFRNEN
jgi:hypothetical protein